MKKNIYDLFLEKILNLPLWVKQSIFLKLSKEMQEKHSDIYMKNPEHDMFSILVPTITFKGKTELSERTCGLDNNTYNFLQCCADELSILEISLNTFLSMEEVSKYYEFCLEQGFIKAPTSTEIHAMAGYIAGKFRIGEYFKQKGKISVDQLQKAILQQRDDSDKKFGEVLVKLGFVKEEDLVTLLILKEESQKRFILDYNSMPNPQTQYISDNKKYEDEIESLKEENLKLKKKMIQLLELVKKNAGQ